MTRRSVTTKKKKKGPPSTSTGTLIGLRLQPGPLTRVVRTEKARKAAEMASQEIDRLAAPSASDEERQHRKRRLLKGPKEFQDLRRNRQGK